MKEFFSESKDLSMVRLCSFLITLVSCMAVLAAVAQPFVTTETSLVDKLPVFIIPFVTLGLSAKVMQKQIEVPNQTPNA